MKTKWKKMEKKDATITTTSISCFFFVELAAERKSLLLLIPSPI